MGVAQSAPQGAHYHADVIYLPLNWERGVYGTPGWARTNSFRYQNSLCPVGQHTFAFYTKYVTSMGQIFSK